MKKPNLLILAVAFAALFTAYPDAPLAQSCYTSTGPGGHYRFREGPAQQCNVDGVYGSQFIGPVLNASFRTNSEVREVYKQALRQVQRAYDDGVQCVNKLARNGAINSELADDHLYHLKTEYEDAQASWEDWYEDVGGNMCD